MKAQKCFILLFSLFFLTTIQLSSLEYEQVIDTLSTAFSDLIDPNEGLTTYRILYIPSGGRAESMGSAFTALANDVSYMEYNPAASSVLENSEIGLFHNSWIADSAVESIAYTNRIKNFGYGASVKCFYVEFTERNFFEDVAKSYYTETVGTLNLAYNFLAGYTFKGLATGINLKGAYRGMPNYTDNDTDEIIPGSGLLQSGFAIMGDLGIQLRFNLAKFYSAREPNLQIGLAASNFGVGYTNLGSSDGLILDDALPSKFAIGLSYKPIRPLTISLEFQQPINLLDISLSEQWACGAGCSVQITNFFMMQTGFLLRGASPRFSLGAEFLVQGFWVNLNYTFDATSSINPVNRISVSAKVNLGDDGRSELQKEIDTLYAKGLQYYSLGEMENAILVWKQILELDPGFDPAKKGVAAAETSIQLQQRINQANFFE